ncbi:MAG: hypothetical protein DRP52_02555 [Planctomycetota bacterium]|nr:MAG: hypothetical protein DRP52_02555 [Planctomycetota bacterium]
MNSRTFQPLGIIIFSLVVALCASPGVHAANDDALLNTLPGDCMFCVRVNNFNESLGKLDSYLAGASPIPVSLAMMANMQLGAAIGDPMLTGIDQGGNFAAFALFPETEGAEPLIGILVPVTDYKKFIETNPNCKPAENGLTLLTAPNSMQGDFLLARASEKYALAGPPTEKAAILAVQKALTAESKLAKRLSADQTKAAATAPVWAYVNLAKLYDKYNKDALAMLAITYEEMAKAGGGMEEMMGFQFKMLAAAFKEFAGEADSATIALTPEPTILSVDVALQAKDGTDLSKMLVADKSTDGYTLSRYLDNNDAVNGLMKMNRPLMQKFYGKMFDIMEAATNESSSKEQTAKMKSLTQKMIAAMGDEVSISYSYASSTPPFKMQEVIEIKDSAAMKALMAEGMDYANTLYKDMGIPVELKYEQSVSTYKDATIDVISISMGKSDDPNNVMRKELEKIYGDDFKYYMAQTNDKFFITMGPDSEKTLKSLIDQPALVSAPSGDIKIAMDALQNTPYTPYDDFVCSVNVIKLIKGMGEMMRTMGVHADMGPGFNMFSSLESIEPKSCLVMGGTVSDGGASLRVAVPKQHLIEVVAMAMQIQQKAMKVQQEMMQNQQPDMTPQMQNSGSSQSPTPIREVPRNPLLSWVGKPAPDMKMTDLYGKTHRISRLKGKKVILDFWATWCPPCKKAIPDLIELAGNGNSNLVILGLSNEATDILTPFAKEAKINYPIIAYNDKNVSAPYNKVTAIPTLFLIDSEGIIQDVLTGYHEPEELRSRLKEIK